MSATPNPLPGPAQPCPLALRSAQERLAEQLSAANAAFSVVTQELHALRIENARLLRENRAVRAANSLNTTMSVIARTPFFPGDPTPPAAN